MRSEKLQARVVRAAEAALADKHYVAPLDVLVGLGWLAPHRLDEWRQGRVPALERVVDANLNNLSTAMRVLRHWAQAQGLQPSETAYVARTRDHRRLQFSASGAPDIEHGYRTHWVSPKLSEAKQARLAEKASRPPELVVISAINDWTCTECSDDSSDLMLLEGPGPLCLICSDLDHLVFLPRGDPALTRRAKKASTLSAVVLRFNRTRRRYERQGILVEDDALQQAEAECLADEEARLRRRQREEKRRPQKDAAFQTEFAGAVRSLFPACPSERAEAIAARAAVRGSGRVGRSAAGRALDPEAVRLAVVASVRHLDTTYDELLMTGVERQEARARVRPVVEQTLEEWSGGPAVNSGCQCVFSE